MPARDVDLFVIGGGSGGVRAARIAASHGARVAIAEESRWGGTCVVRGCVPKKLLVYGAELGATMRHAAGYGWTVDARFDWPTLIARKDAEIDRLSGLYRGNLERAGVELIDGRAHLVDPHTVAVGDARYHAAHILIATGGRPTRPEIPGNDLAITSDEAFHLPALPRRITLVGGGYIGLEFAGIFHGLGAAVTLVHHRREVLRGFDDDIRHAVTADLARQGIELLLDTEVAAIERQAAGHLHFVCRDGSHHEADLVMFATGRLPSTAGLGLAEAGVALGPRGGVIVDPSWRTSVPHIHALGDCTDGPALTPIAVRDGQAFADQQFGPGAAAPAHDAMPTAIFSHPPVGTVGLSERDARAHGPVVVYQSTFTPLFHSLSGSGEKVMLKLVVDEASDRVVGAHMVGRDAPEIIQTLAIAMGMGATKADLDRTLALHPTTAEELVLMRRPRPEPTIGT